MRDHPLKASRLLVTGLLASMALCTLQRTAAGRGCLPEGTPIATPTGQTPIEKLRPSDAVWAVDGSRLVRAKVVARYKYTSERLVTLRAGGRTIRATPEHPFQTAPGVFVEAESLHVGDTLWLLSSDPSPVTIDSVESTAVLEPVYNLMVSPCGTYVAAGFAVHNKGCFLPDTLIQKADGSSIAIREVRPGDAIKAFTADGSVVPTHVVSVVTHEVDEYERVTTDHVVLDVTAEHPFFVGNGTFKTLLALHVGDSIFAFDGVGLRSQRITSIEHIAARITVYNLQTDEPHTFFANGIAVHNKGGHGGGGHGGGHGFGGHSSGHYGVSHHYGGGSGFSNSTSSTQPFDHDSPVALVIFVLLVLAIVYGLHFFQNGMTRSSQLSDLEFVHPRSAVSSRATTTERLMAHLAQTDSSIDPIRLKREIAGMFEKLQQCWEKRDYEPMRPLLMPDLFQSHAMQLEAMKRHHEVNRISSLTIERVDLVHLRYTQRPEQREFTALITARARDYFIDDRTAKFIHGDQTVLRFEEFWIFRQSQGRWLLREIEQSRESHALRQSNLVESLTEEDFQQVAGQDESPTDAPAESRIDALLDDLAERSPEQWNRERLSTLARDLLIALLLAEETGKISSELSGRLGGNVLEAVTNHLAELKQRGETVQYRNLCVRKVELVAANDALDESPARFLARVSAHAQTTLLQGESPLRQDPYELAFVRFLTFSWIDGSWKLTEIHPGH